MKIRTHLDAPLGVCPELRLALVPRWAIISMSKKQSVLEHSAGVAIITAHLATKLGLDEILAGELVVQALFHDYNEIYTGDIPSPVKVEKSSKSSLNPIVKLADLVESYIFAKKYCNDRGQTRRWLLDGLRKKINNSLSVNHITYDVIEGLMEEV